MATFLMCERLLKMEKKQRGSLIPSHSDLFSAQTTDFIHLPSLFEKGLFVQFFYTFLSRFFDYVHI